MVLTDLPKIIFDHHPYYLATKILQFSVNSLCNLVLNSQQKYSRKKNIDKIKKERKKDRKKILIMANS